jgi:hypothetical protein
MIDQANPLGLDGFAFCEFTSPDPATMAAQFEQLGFVAAACIPERKLTLYRQGRIAFILNAGEGQAAAFRALHGPSANGMAFNVADAEAAYALAVIHGATAADTFSSALPHAKAIEGIGGSLLYLVEGDPFAGWEEVPGWRAAPIRSGTRPPSPTAISCLRSIRRNASRSILPRFRSSRRRRALLARSTRWRPLIRIVSPTRTGCDLRRPDPCDAGRCAAWPAGFD